MAAKRTRTAALLLCALAPAAGAAAQPSYAELQKAFDACISVAANNARGELGTKASAWPRGFRGCATVMREVEAREAEDAKRAWARWVAKHAADQALIRKVARQTMVRCAEGIGSQKVCAPQTRETDRSNP